MSKLKKFKGRYCESEFECACIEFLEAEGWNYTNGEKVNRTTIRDVLIADDFKKFLSCTNPDLDEEEINQIYDKLRLFGSESDFTTLRKLYNLMVNGVRFTPKDGLARMVPLIDFETKNPDENKNIFRVVNQFSVE